MREYAIKIAMWFAIFAVYWVFAHTGAYYLDESVEYLIAICALGWMARADVRHIRGEGGR